MLTSALTFNLGVGRPRRTSFDQFRGEPCQGITINCQDYAQSGSTVFPIKAYSLSRYSAS